MLPDSPKCDMTQATIRHVTYAVTEAFLIRNSRFSEEIVDNSEGIVRDSKEISGNSQEMVRNN